MKPIRLGVTFVGRVQGVGFRMTTVRIAEQFPVTGYVRNCADGSVELEVEGAEADVERFLGEVRAVFPGNIRDERQTLRLATGVDGDFSVRY